MKVIITLLFPFEEVGANFLPGFEVVGGYYSPGIYTSTQT